MKSINNDVVGTTPNTSDLAHKSLHNCDAADLQHGPMVPECY